MVKLEPCLRKKMHQQETKIIAILFLCLVSITNSLFSQTNEYQVIAIDTFKNSFVVTIENNDFKGKFISKKTKFKKYRKEKIVIGNFYRFDIERYFLFDFLNKQTFEVETSGMGCVTVDGECIWDTSDNFYLYKSKNLKGLYYKSKIVRLKSLTP